MEKIVKRDWHFTAYGTSVELSVDETTGLPHNGFCGRVAENTLQLWSLHGKGKIVPASTDGLAFYYTVLDAAENFTLEADIRVKQWTFSNGQEGFGLMACDTVGELGEEATLWNNSYLAAVTKVSYSYDREKERVSGDGEPYVMNLGVCALERVGVNPGSSRLLYGEQLANFRSRMYTLECSAAERGLTPGVYNVVGECRNGDGTLSSIKELTEFHLSIQRNNTGYLVSYQDEQGRNTSHMFYHEDGADALTRLDKQHRYVGFFAARNAEIAVRNVKLTTQDPAEDSPAMPPVAEYVMPQFKVESADCANRAAYELVCFGNMDGVLEVEQKRTGERCSTPVKAGKKCRVTLKLLPGENALQLCMLPDADFTHSSYQRLESYAPLQLRHNVSFHTLPADTIYVGPCGREDADGTLQNPMNLYEAVRRVAPGQKLYLLEGIYNMDRPLQLLRGMDGTQKEPVTLEALPGAAERPVLDFGRRSAGISLESSYWHLKGFDIRHTAPRKGGIRVGGSHNVLEDLRIYENGNTGLQLSRCNLTDEWEEWPAHNLVKNCTSYRNADPGNTDSDGFAAKITVAEGNVFDGCISAYNADDGFDLFAKVERGVTGSVTIRNCLAFRNGYIIKEDGREVHAGLGSGFKLGGSSIACGHILENSIAFANGHNGIDSNSCPDVTVTGCVSYANETHNVALFTVDAEKTEFRIRDVISFYEPSSYLPPDRLEPKGEQTLTDLCHVSNYFCNGECCCNVAGEVVQEDWFVSTDTEKAIHGGIHRDEAGKICYSGFLERIPESQNR